MGYKIKSCPFCGKEFQSTNNRQIWCVECKPKGKAKWAADNKDRMASYTAIWHAAHPKVNAVYAATFEKAHPGWNARHALTWRKENPGAMAQWNAEHPNLRKAIEKKRQAKRRSLGFVPLNAFFDGAEAHHINQCEIIYIPKILHQSISHNQWTGHNMVQINVLALQ